MDSRFDMAMGITYDRNKAKLLLDLIDASIALKETEDLKKGKKEQLLALVTSENCKWNRTGSCYLDAPDSVRLCKEICSKFRVR